MKSQTPMNTVSTPASRARFAQLPDRLSAFIKSLSTDELQRLYNAQGRIWLGSVDFEFRVTFDALQARSSHSFVNRGPSAGRWISLSVDLGTHEDHPWDCDENDLSPKWAPDAEWVRRQLVDTQDDLVISLRQVVEYAEELLGAAPSEAVD